MPSIPPPRKRVRRDDEKVLLTPKQECTRLFAPFRALGLVTNHVPFAVQTRATKGSTAPPRIHIVTCLGRSWLMWEGDKMTLLFVGGWYCSFQFRHVLAEWLKLGTELEHPITSLLMDGDAVWATSGSVITKFLRGKPVCITLCSIC
jgi:U3 small nucleolar RNA-associated protein 21